MENVYKLRDSRRNNTKEVFDIIGIPKHDLDLDFILYLRNAHKLYKKDSNHAINVVEYHLYK